MHPFTCRYTSLTEYVVLTCELIFMMVLLCQLHFNVITAIQLQKKYFTNLWNILEVLYLITALIYLVVYLYKYEVVAMLHELLETTFRSSFVSVSSLVYWHRVLKNLMGLLLFLVIIRSLKLLRYIKTFARFGNIYRKASSDMKALFVSSTYSYHRCNLKTHPHTFPFTFFQAVFSLLLIAYSLFGYGLFQSNTLAFSDFGRALLTVTIFMSGKVCYEELRDDTPVIGGVYIVLCAVVTALMAAFVRNVFMVQMYLHVPSAVM